MESEKLTKYWSFKVFLRDLKLNLKIKTINGERLLHLKQGQLPPLHSGPSPNFHHSKKRKTQPLIPLEIILRGCLARKKNEKQNKKERQSKGSVYFFLRELQVSSPSKDYTKRYYIERSFQPPFIVPSQAILSLVDYKEKIVIYTKIWR